LMMSETNFMTISVPLGGVLSVDLPNSVSKRHVLDENCIEKSVSPLWTSPISFWRSHVENCMQIKPDYIESKKELVESSVGRRESHSRQLGCADPYDGASLYSPKQSESTM